MKPPTRFVKRSVAEKKIYQLPKVNYEIKINQNENPYDLPAEIKTEILAAIQRRNWNRYPALGSAGIRVEIGRQLNFPAESVMVGNGSNEVMLAVMTTLLEPGKKLLTVSPTFSLYAHYGSILGADLEVVPLLADFQFPLAKLMTHIQSDNTALTILCSPNNPTGNCLAREDLPDILQAAAGFVMIDEAYFDFCEQDFSGLLADFPNLILLRTFSKACAFSFGRFGYGLANPEFVQEVYKVLLPYNLSGFAETAAHIFLKKRVALNAVIEEIKEQRQWLFHELRLIQGIVAFPSHANFVLIRPDCDSTYLFEQLVAHGILVRDVSSYPGLGNHLRISVGSQKENQIVVTAIKKIMKDF